MPLHIIRGCKHAQLLKLFPVMFGYALSIQIAIQACILPRGAHAALAGPDWPSLVSDCSVCLAAVFSLCRAAGDTLLQAVKCEAFLD